MPQCAKHDTFTCSSISLTVDCCCFSKGTPSTSINSPSLDMEGQLVFTYNRCRARLRFVRRIVWCGWRAAWTVCNPEPGCSLRRKEACTRSKHRQPTCYLSRKHHVSQCASLAKSLGVQLLETKTLQTPSSTPSSSQVNKFDSQMSAEVKFLCSIWFDTTIRCAVSPKCVVRLSQV